MQTNLIQNILEMYCTFSNTIMLILRQTFVIFLRKFKIEAGSVLDTFF